MKKNKLQTYFLSFFFFLFFNLSTNSEIMLLSGCVSTKDGFIKNEYILDLDKFLMTRNYIYNEKTFKKYRLTDLSIKKENSIQRFIYIEDNLIVTDKIGYPQFFTQLIFEKNNPNIKFRTVINSEEGITKLSTCKKIEIYEKES